MHKLLIDIFKEDIRRFFNILTVPILVSKQERKTAFENIEDFTLINPENWPDHTKSLIELGYTYYIERILKYWINPNTWVKIKGTNRYKIVGFNISVSLDRDDL